MARLVLVIAAAAALVACGTSGTLDPRVVAELRVGVAATLDGMGVAPADRPSQRATDDQIALLAIQVEPQRVDALLAGDYDEGRLRDDARDLDGWLDRQRREHHVEQEPPAMLGWLRKQERLTPQERLLMHALIRQAQRETGFQPEQR